MTPPQGCVRILTVPFLSQVLLTEQLPEIRQYLADDAATCIYTNYHFEVAGTVVKEDKPSLNEAIPDLKDGVELKMVEGT